MEKVQKRNEAFQDREEQVGLEAPSLGFRTASTAAVGFSAS